MLSCVRYRSRLGAYLDGELNLKEFEATGDHLAKCVVCQKRLEDIRSLEGPLNGIFHVPPMANGFTARVMKEAQRRRRLKATPERTFLPTRWNPFRRIAELSIPMRIAVCATILLACIVGLSMNGGLILDGQGQLSGSTKNLYGLEWFDSTPPGSIGSIYISMNTQAYEKGNGQ